jgi:hypothetical protein
MASGIESRVREHGNPDEFDPVQDGLGRISSAAPPPGNPVLVDMEFKPVQARILDRGNGVIGADHGAHGASDAGVFHPCFLADAVKGIIIGSMLFFRPDRCFKYSFLKNLQFNGLDRAHGRALPAEGAPVIAVPDLPGQIIEA